MVAARDASELAPFVEEWEELAGEALEPNVFHEPWMMLPAIASYGGGKELRFLLVFAPGEGPPTVPAVLAGVFPLELRREYRRIPVATLALWRYPHCFLGTPLLHRSHAEVALAMFFDWVAGEAREATLLELGRVSGEGPFHRLLLEEIARRGLYAHRAEGYQRALLEPNRDADAYLCQALSGKKRKELRRQTNRLGERGRLAFDELRNGRDPSAWIEEFLRLESSGWKGEQGTALASSEEDRRFFRSITHEAFRRGRLSMLALRLDGVPIAMKCNVETPPGAFALKVAFDQAYARFSPGVSLEIENIRRLHGRREIRWMDSCAEPRHPMIDRLWTERRLIESLVVSMGRRGGDLLVSLLPLLRWLWHRLGKAPLGPRARAVTDGGES